MRRMETIRLQQISCSWRPSKPVCLFDLRRCARLSREVPMIVDVHAHYFPQEYTDLLMRIGGRRLPEAARPRPARPPRQGDPPRPPTRPPHTEQDPGANQVLSPPAHA